MIFLLIRSLTIFFWIYLIPMKLIIKSCLSKIKYIPAFFLKAPKFVIAPHLTLFLNHIFTEDIYPRSCKIARIAPIHKGGAKNETNTYCPISILTCFAKIIEKLIFRDLLNFSKSIKLSMLINMVFVARFCHACNVRCGYFFL